MQTSTEVANALTTFFAKNAAGDVTTFDDVVSGEEAVLAIGSSAREWFAGQKAARGAYGLEGVLIDSGHVDAWDNGDTGWAVARPRFTIPGGQAYRSPGTMIVEGDASSASYFLAAGVIGGGPVRVTGVGRHSIQGDVRFADTLAAMGGTITSGDDWIEARGTGRLKAIDVDLNHIPDAAMTIAAAALFADGTTTIRNIASWRVKETDRIHAMATELRKLGAVVEAGADMIRMTPPARLTPATIDTYDDHRMAMCFSLASFGTAVRINDPACVNKTFPDYFATFASVCR